MASTSRAVLMWAINAVTACVGCSHGEPAMSGRTPPFEATVPGSTARFTDLVPAPGRDQCADLRAHAELSYAEIPHGGAIEIRPLPGEDFYLVRDLAMRVEQTFLPGVRDEERGSCRLFAAGDDVDVTLTEGPQSLRLDFVTFDAGSEMAVRQRVRSFVAEHAD